MQDFITGPISSLARRDRAGAGCSLCARETETSLICTSHLFDARPLTLLSLTIDCIFTPHFVPFIRPSCQ